MECKHKGECFGACSEPKSPAEINMAQAREHRARIEGNVKEHDKVTSRTTGRTSEISLGPNSGGLVPANPFASLAQEGFLHAHPEKLGKKALAHWDAETKGKHLPEHVKKSK